MDINDERNIWNEKKNNGNRNSYAVNRIYRDFVFGNNTSGRRLEHVGGRMELL